MKKCKKCEVFKDYSEYSPDKKSKDRLTYWCRACFNIYSKTRRLSKKDEMNSKKREWYHENRDRELNRTKTWRIENREQYLANSRDYVKQRRLADLDAKREMERNYYHQRRAIDPLYVFTINIRNRLKVALKRKYKVTSAITLLGMDISAVLAYLNLDCLDKYGEPYTGNEQKYHIDHIRPLCSFNLLNQEELQEACHWSNLQILTKGENLRKGKKILT